MLHDVQPSATINCEPYSYVEVNKSRNHRLSPAQRTQKAAQPQQHILHSKSNFTRTKACHKLRLRLALHDSFVA